MHLMYIATDFESLTHTFIAREVQALRDRGHRVDLMALRRGDGPPASAPECDTSDCHWVFPASLLAMLASVGKTAWTRPRRWWHAVSVALGAAGESLTGRAKLLGQLVVATTALDHVERKQPQVLHAHLAHPPGAYAMFLSLLSGIPYTFTAHAADIYRTPLATEPKLRHAAGVVAISRYNLAHYRALVPEVRRAAVIHCGVPVDRFEMRARDRVHRPLRIVAVGRAVQKKGFGDLLSALSRLDHRTHPWRASLIGGGPLMDELRDQRERLGLDELEMTGPRQFHEVQDALADADVFCLPCVEADDGDIDGIPVALMEAMASGCPVLSTTVSGIPELLADDAGLLVAPHDPDAVAAALRRLIDEPELAPQLSRRGRQRILDDFASDREAERLELFFGGVLAGRLPDRLYDRDPLAPADPSPSNSP